MILNRFLGISLILASCDSSYVSLENVKDSDPNSLEYKNIPNKQENIPQKKQEVIEIKEKEISRKKQKPLQKPKSKIKKQEIINKLDIIEKDIDSLEDRLHKF